MNPDLLREKLLEIVGAFHKVQDSQYETIRRLDALLRMLDAKPSDLEFQNYSSDSIAGPQ